MPHVEPTDILHGYIEIGEFLRLSPKQAEHHARAKEISTFKLGRIVCARKSSILAAIEAAERQSARRAS